MAATGKEHLDFPDQPCKPSSFLESFLLVTQERKRRGEVDGGTKAGPLTTPMAPSQVLGKVKDFLGVMAKANEKLELEKQEASSANYDIEVLNGSEQEYIEMDLLLGVADLHSSEAMAAAEATMSGFQPSMTSSKICSDTEDDSDDNDNMSNIDETSSALDKFEKSDLVKNDKICSKNPRKRPKIVVLN